MSVPWLKFYPTDWRADPKLRMCSLAARGLWMEMICIMHESVPYGTLRINGIAVSDSKMQMLAGDNCRDLIEELEEAGVLSREEDGTIFSRRMVRDFEKAEKDKANGKRGGNPKLAEGVNPPVKTEDKAQIPDTRYQIDSSLRSESVKKKYDYEFENQFWPVYPRKVSKGAALKAFKAARRKADLEAILSGAIRFAKARQGEDANFTKHAASWLNAECWKDEPDPPPRIGSSRPNGRPLNAADAMREKWRNDAENGSRDSRDVELLSSDQSGSAAFDWFDYKALPGPLRSGDH